ncbi:hypothetical protein CCH79_00005518 [Gambusia affinis]|uniref:Uncharacterized protein n=1 Tax=Gambusia affinis TaxID=33528 RepID=A0A315VHT3_GAMAF|nr:hypothetical protein CCH79_00005518 [Gambusia affinis]
MAVQETAAQLSMALKVQEYPTLKVNTAHTGTRPWFRVLQVPGGFGSVLKRRDSPAKSENQPNLNPAADPVRGAGSVWFWAVGGSGKRFGVLAQCHQIPAASVRFKMASRRNRRRLPHTRTAPPSHGAGLRHRRTRSNDSASTPTPAVPYETLNKRFRAAQKNIDRETSHVTMVVAELEKTLSSFPVVDSVVSLLDGVVEKLSALKRKVRDPVELK